uniref:Uncharacterized protein n=1 Tax=Arundo donax TaxID=35708 RepID=A0A0A9BKK7_ARUDO
MIILGAWSLWKHRNACVFNDISPSICEAIRSFREEHQLWCLVGAKSLRELDLGLAVEPD